MCSGAHTSYNPACPQRQKQFDAVLKARKERLFRFPTQLQLNPTVESSETAHVPKLPDDKLNNAASMPAGTQTSITSNVPIQLNNPSILESTPQERQATKTGSCQASTATPKETNGMFTIYEDIDPELLVPALNLSPSRASPLSQILLKEEKFMHVPQQQQPSPQPPLGKKRVSISKSASKRKRQSLTENKKLVLQTALNFLKEGGCYNRHQKG